MDMEAFTGGVLVLASQRLLQRLVRVCTQQNHERSHQKPSQPTIAAQLEFERYTIVNVKSSNC